MLQLRVENSRQQMLRMLGSIAQHEILLREENASLTRLINYFKMELFYRFFLNFLKRTINNKKTITPKISFYFTVCKLLR